MGWIGTHSTPKELWNCVIPFETREHARRIYSDMHSQPASCQKTTAISATFAQGRMYFESAEAAPIGVRPVLLYYGAVALMTGLALLRNPALNQQDWPASHGLRAVGWRDVLFGPDTDVLKLAIQATNKGSWAHIVDTVWNGHIETVHFGRLQKRETAPYQHRLGELKFVGDGTNVTFADLVSRSRYTGGLYGSLTNRPRALLRGTVWMDPGRRPAGMHVSISLDQRQNGTWLLEEAKNSARELLGPDQNPYGAVFPRRDYKPDEVDELPVFHFERWGEMSVSEPMPNGDRPSELLKLYLMAYVVGMFARYYPTQWLAVIHGHSASSDASLFTSAVAAIEQNFVREFCAQLAVITNDPHFFGPHFGSQAVTVAPDWRKYIGTTGTGKALLPARP